MTGTFGLEGLVAYAYHGEHESLDIVQHFFPDSERDTWVLPDCVLVALCPTLVGRYHSRVFVIQVSYCPVRR